MNPLANSLYQKLITLILISIFISGCQTISTQKGWPQDIPDRALFVEAYNNQAAAGANNEPIDSHLRWIVKFYEGSVFYPVGWNDMIELVVNSVESEQDKAMATKRLSDLGFKISVEWAQSNSARNIDSSNVAVWGTALRTSVERKEQFTFMDKVEADVDDLIAGKLSPSDIKQERYYPAEDYDNF